MSNFAFNQTVYTKNNDGTLEKWFFVGVEDDGKLCLRKGSKTKQKYRDYLKSFNAEKVFASRKAALESEVMK